MKRDEFLFDTDVVIDYLRGELQAVKFLEKNLGTATCYLSSVTVAELFSRIRDRNEENILNNFLNAFAIIDLNKSIAKNGGAYRSHYGKSHGVGLVDCIIAATVDEIHAKLVTLNKKHYPMLKHIVVPYQK